MPVKKSTKKKVVKKPVKKKAVKKVLKKKVSKKVAPKTKKEPSSSAKATKDKKIKKINGKLIDLNKEKPIGKIIHFYGKIKVGVIEVAKGKQVKVGETLYYSGNTTDFAEELKSMQEFGKQVAVVKGKKQVGIKIGKKVRQGDRVYRIK